MKTIQVLLLSCLLTIALAACGGEDLGAKRNAVIDEYNSITEMTQQTTARLSEAIANGVEVSQDGIAAYEEAREKLNNLGDVLSNLDNATSEELDELSADLAELKSVMTAEHGKITSWLDEMEAGAGAGAGADVEQGGDLSDEASVFLGVFEAAKDQHNGLVDFLNSLVAEGYEVDADAVEQINGLSDEINLIQRGIDNGELETMSSEDLSALSEQVAEYGVTISFLHGVLEGLTE